MLKLGCENYCKWLFQMYLFLCVSSGVCLLLHIYILDFSRCIDSCIFLAVSGDVVLTPVYPDYSRCIDSCIFLAVSDVLIPVCC